MTPTEIAELAGVGVAGVGGFIAWMTKRLDKRRARKEAAIDGKVLYMLPYTPTDPNLSPSFTEYVVKFSGLTREEVEASLLRLLRAGRVEQKDGGWQCTARTNK